MATDYTQSQLEEMVVGKNPNPRAMFYEQAVLNVEKSKAANRRMYDKKIYIKLTQPGVRDSMSYEAQKNDIAEYRKEYDYFMQNRQGQKTPDISIIPNLDIAHLQELRDYGILTIPQLAAMEVVPPHLEYAFKAAKVFNKALQETSHAEEESIEETRTEAEQAGFQSRRAEASPLPPQDRPEHRTDVRRQEVPGGDSGGIRATDDPGRHAESRPIQRGYPIISDNWSIEM
jgi:hypothetical protein